MIKRGRRFAVSPVAAAVTTTTGRRKKKLACVTYTQTLLEAV